MNLSSRYQINTAEVVSDILDGEVIIIQLDTGIYYSAQGSAATIWELIQEGASIRRVIAGLVSTFDGDPMEMSFAVAPFVTELLAQRLIVEIEGDAPDLPVMPVEAKQPFATPKLEIFRDMQNLLIIDPVHAVDISKGWPAVPPSNA